MADQKRDTQREARDTGSQQPVTPARTTAPDGLFRLEWWMPVVVFLSALWLRLYHIGYVRVWWDDSQRQVIEAFAYTQHGLIGPDNWWTQPLKHILLDASIHLFGNDPVAWRLREVFFGALAVLLVFLIARRAFGKPFPAIAAATLLALDPLGVAMARNTIEDVGASCLMLAAILLSFRALQYDRDRDWIALGIGIGLCAAMRWWAVAPGLVMIGLVMWRSRRRPRELGRKLAFLTCLPLAVYGLAFGPWFARGNGFPDFARLQIDSLTAQGAQSASMYRAGDYVLAGAWRWFDGIVAAGLSQGTAGGSGAFSVMMNDPVLWILFVPATAYLVWLSAKAGKAAGLLIGGSFVLLYGFFVVSPRPIFLYSACAVVPLGFLAVGFAADRLLGKRAWIFLGAAAAWSLYLFPLASAMPVPLWAYAWLLRPLGVM